MGPQPNLIQSVAGRPVSPATRVHFPPGVIRRHAETVERNRHDPAGEQGPGDGFVRMNHLRVGWNGHGQIAHHVPSRLMAQHERLRRRTVEQPQRYSRIGRMQDRTLSFDDQQFPVFPLQDQSFHGARDVIRDHGVHRDARPGDHDAGLPRRHELGVPACLQGRPAYFDCGHLLTDARVGADGQHPQVGNAVDQVASHVQVVRGLSHIPQPNAFLFGVPRERLVFVQESMEPVDHLEPVFNRLVNDRPPCSGQDAARRRDADDQRGRAVGQRLFHGRHDRDSMADLEHIFQFFSRVNAVEHRYGFFGLVAYQRRGRLGGERTQQPLRENDHPPVVHVPVDPH